MATKPKASECAVKILDAVPPAIWFIRGHMRRHRQGLSVPQFRALYFINDNPSVSLSEVAEHLGASLPSASRLAAGLQGKNLIRRIGGKGDRRRVELIITSMGATVLDSARMATLAQIDGKLAQLSDAQRAALGKGMNLLRTLFDPARAAAGKIRQT